MAGLVAEAGAARRARDAWRGRHEGLRREQAGLARLHEQQGARLEALLSRQATLQAALRALRLEHRQLQDKYWKSGARVVAWAGVRDGAGVMVSHGVWHPEGQWSE